MKTFADPAQAAIERGDAIVSGAIAIYSDPAIFVWGGLDFLTFAGDTGDETYQPLGDRGFAQLTAGALGGAAQNVTVTLSGIDPAALEVLDAAEVARAPTVIRRLIFDNAGRTLLDAYVFTRGRVDTVQSVETIGGQAAIQVQIETAARGLGRRGGRMRSDADQRLVNPTDGFFKNVSFAAQKTLYWGGKRPATAGGALGGVGAGGSVLDTPARLNYDQFIGNSGN